MAVEKIVLKGKKGILLKDGVRLKTLIKDTEKELAKVKKDLKLDKAGVYANSDGDTLVIGDTKVFTDIDPHKVFRYLKKAANLKEFWGSVKVNLAALKKNVPENTYDKWREELDSTKRWTWKVK